MRKLPLSAQIVVAFGAAIPLGLALGPGAGPLGELGKAVITLIKALATPLLALAVVQAVSRTTGIGRRNGLALITISAVNGVIALGIGLALSNYFEPGKKMNFPPASGTIEKTIEPVKALSGHVPSSIVQPWIDNAIIPLVVLCLLAGFALRRSRERDPIRYQPVGDAIEVLHGVAETMVGWVIRLVPLAVFGTVAKVIGESGWSAVSRLWIYLAVGIAGLLVQILVVYQVWLRAVARIPLARFWSIAREPVVYALGASSSLATLPVTLGALEKLGVSKESSRLSACVGTNLNNDGILLYEAMAALLVAQAYGIELSLAQQASVALSCAIAGIGIAGVPEAGLISLALVLSTARLPTECVPLLLTVDWILSRARAATNVIGDITMAASLDRIAPPKTAESAEALG